MDVTVIVPARNAEKTVGKCVEALKHQSFPADRFEILVVDDGSTDGTALVAGAAGAQVLCISASGVAAARNRGVEKARGKTILFTDADCIPDSDWIRKMVAPFSDPDVISTKGVYRSDQSALTARFVQREYESRYDRMSARDSIDFVDTYAAGFRKHLFVQAGGYDERFPVGEDQEFSFRYSRLGGRVVFLRDAVVTHLHVDRPWNYFRKKMRIGFWKTRVLSYHPDKILSDSHTPQTLKLEIASAFGAGFSALFSFHPVGLAALLATLSVFSGCTLRLTLKIFRQDRQLAWVAPGFIFLRAIALGIGLSAGVFLGAYRPSSCRKRRLSWVRPQGSDVPVGDEEESKRIHEFA